MNEERIQLRIHGTSDLPTLVYLPGLHGDWTLVSSFRAAVKGKLRFAEFTYPRTLTWSLEDYARAVSDALIANNIRSGWLLGESFSSQVAWQILDLSRCGDERPAFSAKGIILAGGFATYPILAGVRLVRSVNGMMPPWMIRVALRIYARYARLRHRRAPETLASIGEFIGRRTEPDRQAILHRYGLIISSGAGVIACRCRCPIYALSGFFDPVVPWPLVVRSLRRNCPGFRDWRVVFDADHNVLGTAPTVSAAQITSWISSAEGG